VGPRARTCAESTPSALKSTRVLSWGCEQVYGYMLLAFCVARNDEEAFAFCQCVQLGNARAFSSVTLVRSCRH
jgi:hypothetical protein